MSYWHLDIMMYYIMLCHFMIKDLWCSPRMLHGWHFEKAFALSSEWLHALYLGKFCEKLGRPSAKAFWYYMKARELKPTAVDPFYRLHAPRLKLLYTHGKQSYVIQTVASYAYNESAKEAICAMLG